jgi:hypothetical protein
MRLGAVWFSSRPIHRKYYVIMLPAVNSPSEAPRLMRLLQLRLLTPFQHPPYAPNVHKQSTDEQGVAPQVESSHIQDRRESAN